MTTCFSMLAWKIPRTEESCGLAKKSHMTQQLNKNNNNECNNKKKEKQMNSLSKSKNGECQETKAKAVDTLSS